MRSEYVKEKLFPFKVESCASFIIDDQIGLELYFPSILVNFLIQKKVNDIFLFSWQLILQTKSAYTVSCFVTENDFCCEYIKEKSFNVSR